MRTNLRIFLVEDNPIDPDRLSEYMKGSVQSEIVGSARSETDAAGWLNANQQSWDLAVVDVFLALGSGLGVLKRCRHRMHGKQIVVLSDYATPEILHRCRQDGADAIFHKSQEIEEFTLYLQTYLASLEVASRGEMAPIDFSQMMYPFSSA